MLAILAPILVFGLVIFVHEFGHFLAAKATGVYAPRFAIGFGPSLWHHRFGETEYTLNVLPLGGFVRMASRHDDEMAFIEGGSEEEGRRAENDPDYDPEALMPFGPKPVPENRLFESKPLWARIVIMIAGVTMNILLGFVVSVALAFHYGRSVVETRVVGAVHPPASAPALAQLQPGDTVRAVNGVPVRTWNDVEKEIAGSRGAVTFTTQRGAVRVPLGPSTSADDVAEAIDYYIPAVMDSIVPGDRAAAAGFQPGDSVVAIGGTPVRNWFDLVSRVSQSPNTPLTFEVARQGAVRTLTVTPRAAPGQDSTSGSAKVVGKIGAAPRDPVGRQPVGPVEAVTAGARATWVTSASIVGFVKKLFTGELSVRNLGGPIAITRVSVQAARSGPEQLFWLIAFLSINVAILNLLPIPILDGGQILLNVVESAKGSPFSLRTREYILRFGLLAIALLFVMVMYNDTHDLFGKLFGWVARLFG